MTDELQESKKKHSVITVTLVTVMCMEQNHKHDWISRDSNKY